MVRHERTVSWIIGFMWGVVWLAMGVALTLIVLAGNISEQHPSIRDFTKGLMGVFVCWTPQIVLFAAFAAGLPGISHRHPVEEESNYSS